MLAPVSSSPSPTLFAQVRKALPIVLLIMSVAAAVFALYKLWSSWRASSLPDAGGAARAPVRAPSSAALPRNAPVFEAEDWEQGDSLHGAQKWTANICDVQVAISPLNSRNGDFSRLGIASSTSSEAYLQRLRKQQGGNSPSLYLKLDDSAFDHTGCLETGVNAFLAARTYIGERKVADQGRTELGHLAEIRIYWLIGRGNGFPTIAHLTEFRRRLDLAFQTCPV